MVIKIRSLTARYKYWLFCREDGNSMALAEVKVILKHMAVCGVMDKL